MRLTKIKLAGFKSFVDPTTIPLPSDLVGVVGPNGCGKSNIIDAVRWVMGESSAKHLRGDSMADVIFNGSSSRKPVGQAAIELVFDNSDGSVGGQYANYNEIAIKRTVSRDGQSVYHLNGTRCRRRDITDIFLGTGLGPRSYAIIEQGTISRLIEAKPEELRVFLEEAAGISKYKERRRETENRIRHTRENLERLTDLREELDKQLAHLQRQARTAERYKELKAEEREHKGQLQALRWRALDTEVVAREEAIREQETLLEAEVARQRSAEAEIERQRESHTEASETFNTVQSEYYRVGADIARLEQSIQHARERYQQQREDLEQVERSLREAESHITQDRDRITTLRSSLEAETPALEAAREAEEMAAAALAEAEERMHGWQGRWEQFNQQAAEPSQTAQVERARIQHLERQQAQYRQRRHRFVEERQALSTETLEAAITELQETQAEAELGGGELRERLESVRERIDGQREENNRHGSDLDRLRTELQHKRGRHASLEALQQAALGKREGAVSEWLEQHGLGGAERLAEGLKVNDGWERAVETVLGQHLEAVCVSGLDPVAALLDDLEHGDLTLFDTAVPGEAVPAAGRLLEQVHAPWRLASLLAGVRTADTLEQALAMRGTLAVHESVVTRDGIWLGPEWLRVARDADERAGVLHREQELRALELEIGHLDRQANEAAEAVERGREALRHLEEERERLQRELDRSAQQQAELKAQLSGKQARLEQIRHRRERLENEEEEVRRQEEEAALEMETAREQLHRALETMERLAMERESLEQERAGLRDSLEAARERARTAREAAQQVAIRVETLRTELTSTEQATERMAAQVRMLAGRREELAGALADGDAPIQEMSARLETRLEERMQVETRLADARRRVQDIEHTLREQEQARMAAERKVQENRSSLERLRMAWQEMIVRRQTLQEQVVEAGFDLQALLERLPEAADIGEWEQALEQVGQRIQRLGPINLAAIDEFEQQSERKRYLDAQDEDLMEALETLENAIRKIDRETRTRFKETYDRVNKGLQEKFPRLFGGGHAYLDLTGDDLLDTGVTVMARPPGKRNSTIHLLSGGEKALTAVALVFAIFELNPSPFCMLDEVDAPLDEANVGRFCNLVQEMSERVQFIFITHNKATMELAKHLAGVTMQEPGVSRMVAVDVDEAVELAAV